MQRKLVLEFTKMNGAGNDFIVIDNRFYHFSDAELADLARRFCPRRTGIGADGVLAFMQPEDDGHHYRMRYVNADGSLATMCGNGARCLARFARQAGVMDETLVFETDAGVYRANAPHDVDAPVRLYVGPPRDIQPAITLTDEAAAEVGALHYIWMGTEHVVCFVDDVDTVPVEPLGRAIRNDEALAPAGANVNFVEVMRTGTEETPAAIRIRTYEKGVEGETLACGTGALGSAIVARLLDRVATDTIAVHAAGGMLGVGFRIDEGTIRDLYLEGPAVTVFRGTAEV